MSINAPSSFTVTGDVSLTISVTWASNPAGSSFTVNSNTYPMLSIFDNPQPILRDIQLAGNCTAAQAQFIFQYLKTLIKNYQLQVLQIHNHRFSMAVA